MKNLITNKKVLFSVLTVMFLFSRPTQLFAQEVFTSSNPVFSGAVFTTSNPVYSEPIFTTSNPFYFDTPVTTSDPYSVVPVTTTYPTDPYSVVPVTYTVDSPSYSGGYTSSPSYTNSGGLFGSGFNISTPSFSFSLGGSNAGYTNFGYTQPFGFTSYAQQTITCGAGQNLVNGVCQTIVTCGAGMSVVNGVCQTTVTCGAGQVLVNGVCTTPTTCGAGQTLINGVCTTNITCGVGQVLVNGVCQLTTVSCPANTTLINGVCQPNTVCPSGTTYINGICQPQISCPANTILLNGVCQPNSYTSPYGYTGGYYTNYGYTNYNSYQTCWDGSVIPAGQVCAQQYKTCANGSMIPASQTCFMRCPNGQSVPEYMSCPYTSKPVAYSAPIKIDFNNVVTSITTQITKNSARCNGIGLIAGGAQSTGWFEYGETPNLGRDTSKVSIGSDYTAPFSNVLTNLKTNNTYFCRAVMSNEHGVVKGEIVRFTTGDKKISYITPKVVTTKKVVKNEVTCSDGTVLKTSSSQASIINNGDKLATTVLEKVNGEISPNNELNYRFNYKNISEGLLDNVIIKINVPQEFSFVSSNVGSYDDITHTLTFNQNTMDASNEGVVSFKVKVLNTASIGKSVVSTGYLSYTFKSADGKVMADEVISYSVGSIIPVNNFNSGTGAKNVVGTSSDSFLPSSLVEWFALIAIMFILYVLGRSIYATYNEEEKKGQH